MKFHEFMPERGTSERHQNNNLKDLATIANGLRIDLTA